MRFRTEQMPLSCRAIRCQLTSVCYPSFGVLRFSPLTHPGAVIKKIALLWLVLTAFVQAEDGALPPACEKILQRMDHEIAEVQEKALRLLDKEFKEATKHGDLAVAEKIKAKIDELNSMMPDLLGERKVTLLSNPKRLIGRWKRNTDGTIWIFRADMTGTYNGNTELKYAFDSTIGEWILTSASWVDRIKSGKDANFLQGLTHDAKPYILSRVE
jgi:hypothetical protein